MSDVTQPLPPIDPLALRTLGERLADPEFRAAFLQDPEQATESFKVPQLPQELIDYLAGLTDEQLALIAEVSAYLRPFPVIAEWL